MRMVLSCVSYQHVALKQNWAKAKEETDRPPDVLGRLEKPPEEKDGIVCIIDETGTIHKSLRIWMPTGILVSRMHMLVTSPWGIHRVDHDLSHVDWNIFSMRWFNGLHSISRTQSGFLVTSTGLDLLVEVDQAGQVLWTWWALDHGLNVTPMGRQRYVKRSADHRGFFYSTTAHTTHINSAVELPNGDILATLFHQGMVIYIQRKCGRWNPLLENLSHPHFVRLQGEDSFTVADSAHGRALLAKMSSSEKAYIVKKIDLDTEWLADCFYDQEHSIWWLLDAQDSHVVIFDEKSRKYSHLVFDPEWRLYSLEPLEPGMLL